MVPIRAFYPPPTWTVKNINPPNARPHRMQIQPYAWISKRLGKGGELKEKIYVNSGWRDGKSKKTEKIKKVVRCEEDKERIEANRWTPKAEKEHGERSKKGKRRHGWAEKPSKWNKRGKIIKRWAKKGKSPGGDEPCYSYYVKMSSKKLFVFELKKGQ